MTPRSDVAGPRDRRRTRTRRFAVLIVGLGATTSNAAPGALRPAGQVRSVLSARPGGSEDAAGAEPRTWVILPQADGDLGLQVNSVAAHLATTAASNPVNLVAVL